jgi:ankyrin repeat protein
MTYRALGKWTSSIRAHAGIAFSVVFGLLVTGAIHGQETTPPSPAVLADAVLAKDLALVRKLIEQGADVHGLDTRPEVAGANGRRPLNWAALKHDTKMIELLLELGADIDRQNLSGFTPLHHAVEAQSVEAIKLLLARGADTTIENKRGQTPAEFAVSTRRHRSAAALGVSDAQ